MINILSYIIVDCDLLEHVFMFYKIQYVKGPVFFWDVQSQHWN